jgi:lysozyme
MISRIRQNGKATAVGVALIAMVGSFEGVKTIAYRDPVGVPTICFGETRGVKMGDRATLAECRNMLADRLVEFETGMRKCLKAPDSIPDGPYQSFLSFSYNAGTSAFCSSTMARRVNDGDLRGACNEFPKWTKASGPFGTKVTLPGLVKRRKEEQALCLTGVK